MDMPSVGEIIPGCVSCVAQYFSSQAFAKVEAKSVLQNFAAAPPTKPIDPFAWARAAELAERCSKRRFLTSEQAFNWRIRNSTGRSGLCLKSQNVVPYRLPCVIKLRINNNLQNLFCQ